MAELNFLHTLRAKRDEIGRHIRDLERRLDQAKADFAHVSASIRLFEIGPSETTTQFPVYIKLTKLFQRGELIRLCGEALERAGVDGVTTKDIAAHVMLAKGWDTADKALFVSVNHSVVTTLGERFKKRQVQKLGKRAGVIVWAKSRPPS